MNTDKGKEYFAFISYKREDEKWAKWLQHKLEHYHLPSNVRKANESLPKSIRPIFKDTSELSAGVLADEIHEALEKSKYLIVICSPRAAQSQWVGKEVQSFIDMGRTKQIIPFIIEGSVFAQDSNEECFPSALLNLPKEQELLGVNINEMGRDAAAVKVVARMFDLKFDTLWQRWERDKRNQRNRKFAIIAGIVLLFAIGASISLYKIANERDRANAEAKRANTEANRANAERKKTEQANASLEVAYTRLKIKNDSIELQNKLIAQQKSDLNKSNDELLFANTRLKEEKEEVVKSKRKMQENLYKYLAKECQTLIDNGDSYLARMLATECFPENDRSEPLRPYVAEVEAVLRKAYNYDSGVLNEFGNIYMGDKTGGEILSTFIWDDRSGFSRIATLGYDIESNVPILKLKIWNAQSAFLLKEKPIEGSFKRIDGVGSIIMLIGEKYNGKGYLEFYDSNTLDRINSLEVDGYIADALFKGNNKVFYTEDSIGVVYDLDMGAAKKFQGHRKKIISIGAGLFLGTISGNEVVTLSEDSTLCIWNINKGQLVNSFDVSNSYKKVLKSGKFIIAHSDKLIATYDKNTGRLLYELHPLSPISSVTIYESFLEGKTRIECVNGGQIDYWNIETGEYIGRSNNTRKILQKTNYHSVGNNITIKYFNPWEISFEKQISLDRKYNYREISSKKVNIKDASFNSNSKKMVIGHDSIVEIWTFPKEKQILTGHEGDVNFVIFSPHDEYILSGSADKTLRLWDSTTGKVTGILRGHTDDVMKGVFSRDGKYIASISKDSTLIIWDIVSRTPIKTFKFYRDFCSLNFSNDGKFLFMSTTSEVYLWNTINWKREVISELRDMMGSYSMSPYNNSIVYSNCLEPCLMLYDKNKSKKTILNITKSSLWYNYLQFSPDGRYIMGVDLNAIYIWHAATGILMDKFNLTDNFLNIKFSPDGKKILYFFEGAMGYHDFYSIEELVEKYRKQFEGRGLPPEEKRKYYLE